MISTLRGTVVAVSGTTVVIEIGGVGLSVSVTPALGLALRVGAEASFHTALIVREDDLSLFGFENRDELTVFDALRGVTGVGPRSAMGVVGVLSPREIALAVMSEDDSVFRRVSGIGPKTAKLICVSLAGKLATFADTVVVESTAPRAVSNSVVVALVGLGWPERVAMTAVEQVAAGATEADSASPARLLRLALAMLGPQQLAGNDS
ncbi:MAG: Holliday junction branch migration protein RuvA [Microbacteriaceae bacterium]